MRRLVFLRFLSLPALFSSSGSGAFITAITSLHGSQSLQLTDLYGIVAAGGEWHDFVFYGDGSTGPASGCGCEHAPRD